MSKVAITDYTFEPIDVEREILEPLGCELVLAQGRTAPELIEVVADADCVITQFAQVTAEVIAAMRHVRVIVRCGIGYDNVDLEAAKSKGIPVCNVPDYCIDEVADQTLAFILSLTRSVIPNHKCLRNGKWGLGVPLSSMKNLRDMTIGVVGCGRIGREVVRRIVPFKSRVLVFDPLVPQAEIERLGAVQAPLEQVFAESDLLTLHCPSTPQTRRMVNRTSLAQMKQGALLVNVGRGDLVESAALVEALLQGHLAGAALDVFEVEPLPQESSLLAMDNVIVASHIASTSVKAMRQLRHSTANTVACAVRGEKVPNIVNGVKP